VRERFSHAHAYLEFTRCSGPVAGTVAGWDGYQFDRTQLFELIVKKGIDNTLLLTGDIHTSWANELKIDPDDPTEKAIRIRRREELGKGRRSFPLERLPARTAEEALLA
jgi:hypothetical protein